jgi:hypothetical protein
MCCIAVLTYIAYYDVQNVCVSLCVRVCTDKCQIFISNQCYVLVTTVIQFKVKI